MKRNYETELLPFADGIIYGCCKQYIIDFAQETFKKEKANIDDLRVMAYRTENLLEIMDKSYDEYLLLSEILRYLKDAILENDKLTKQKDIQKNSAERFVNFVGDKDGNMTPATWSGMNNTKK